MLKQAFPPALLFCLHHPGSRPHGYPQGPHRQQLGGRTFSSASSASQVHLTSYLLSCPVTTARFNPHQSPPTPRPKLAVAVASSAPLSGLEYAGAEAQSAYTARQSLTQQKALVLYPVTTQGGRRAQCSGLCGFGLARNSLCQPAAL